MNLNEAEKSARELLARVSPHYQKYRGFSQLSWRTKNEWVEVSAAIAAILEVESAQAATIRELRSALERVKEELTIPAAEYVPAIPDCWNIIDAALEVKP